MKPTHQFDAIIIGAGLGGINSLHEVLELGLSVRVLERASEVGGTWFYNQYPGCTSDTPSLLYRLDWDKEDLRTYPWPNRYLTQPEILAYIKHVVSKHNMGPHIQPNTDVTSATWDPSQHRWLVQTNNTSETFTTRYLITAVGVLHEPVLPSIPGMHTFRGDLLHSTQWTPLHRHRQQTRVGIIGSGASGIQILTAIAPHTASTTSFQRTPQYAIPARNAAITPAERASYNARYDAIIDAVWDSATGFGFPESTTPTMSVSPDERVRVFEALWREGGAMQFMLGGFSDTFTDAAANEAACAFIRGKIAATVEDPEKARRVMPTERFFARRPLCEEGYYEALNRENVRVVALGETPIERFTPEGIRTSDGVVHGLDVVVFATGFDAIEGSYTRFPIRGREGKLLMEHWGDGAKSYLGVSCPGFPNLFFVNGPQGPFGNVPPVLQSTAQLTTELIKEAEKTLAKGGLGVMEATPEAEADWGQRCEQMMEGSLFKHSSSWITGRNVEGRAYACRFFLGGIKLYRSAWRDAQDQGWPGFLKL
ncbi:hypothetical protein BFW01_g5915 [Lasiodiplodia theobromae]|nr:hypothetical protein BFW01_g5915 [Lasiodiplodia theobromae]